MSSRFMWTGKYLILNYIWYLWLFVDTICQQGKGLDVKKLLRKENANEDKSFEWTLRNNYILGYLQIFNNLKVKTVLK